MEAGEPEPGGSLTGWACPLCGGSGLLRDSRSEAVPPFFCPRCGAVVETTHRGIKIEVSGNVSEEVQRVAAALAKDAAAQQADPNLMRTPWVSGSFYLVCLLVVVVLLLVVARTAPLLALPVIVIAGLLAVAIVGAFQLRTDKALSETGFLSLMGLALQRLPLVVGKRDPRHRADNNIDPSDDQESET